MTPIKPAATTIVHRPRECHRAVTKTVMISGFCQRLKKILSKINALHNRLKFGQSDEASRTQWIFPAGGNLSPALSTASVGFFPVDYSYRNVLGGGRIMTRAHDAG